MNITHTSHNFTWGNPCSYCNALIDSPAARVVCLQQPPTPPQAIGSAAPQPAEWAIEQAEKRGLIHGPKAEGRADMIADRLQQFDCSAEA